MILLCTINAEIEWKGGPVGVQRTVRERRKKMLFIFFNRVSRKGPREK